MIERTQQTREDLLLWLFKGRLLKTLYGFTLPHTLPLPIVKYAEPTAEPDNVIPMLRALYKHPVCDDMPAVRQFIPHTEWSTSTTLWLNEPAVETIVWAEPLSFRSKDVRLLRWFWNRGDSRTSYWMQRE